MKYIKQDNILNRETDGYLSKGNKVIPEESLAHQNGIFIMDVCVKRLMRRGVVNNCLRIKWYNLKKRKKRYI